MLNLTLSNGDASSSMAPRLILSANLILRIFPVIFFGSVDIYIITCGHFDRCSFDSTNFYKQFVIVTH